MKRPLIVSLLSFNGGFVDTTGFLGLQGLFTAHVTGNFVTAGYAIVFGTHGVTAKLIALPEFIVMVGLARLIGAAMRAKTWPDLKILLGVKVALLLAFFVLAVRFGPFPDSDSPVALLAGFTAIAAMAIQNAVHRVHFSTLPPTTLMTGNVTQATLDAVDLLSGMTGGQSATIRLRMVRTLTGILAFAAGCALAAVLYAWIGFWCLAVPVVTGAVSAIVRIGD
jgi:uncharacterized membrane protein YoaK (UPF0700 family)